MGVRYYDERYYLGENNDLERKWLLYEQCKWTVICDCEKANCAPLITDYNLYIKLVKKLIDEITPSKDDLGKIHTIMNLIMDGIFSYSDNFRNTSSRVDILYSKPGVNILYGKGSCRHVGGFISDVMPDSRILTCVGEKDNPYESEVNHVINLIDYNGKKYGFDAYNRGILYNFISEFEMESVNDDVNDCLNYKPYGEIMFYRRSFEEIKELLEQIKKNGNSTISYEQLSDIALSSQLSIASNMDIIEDFLSDSRSQVRSIKEKIKEMKIRR